MHFSRKQCIFNLTIFVSVVIFLIICYNLSENGFISSLDVRIFGGRLSEKFHFTNPRSEPISFGSGLQISQLVPETIKKMNENISYKGYMDSSYDRKCGIPRDHEALFEIMKIWIEITARYNITWWMVYGSLIGSLRHQDMIPWDTDIDIGVPSQYESVLRNISTPRSEISDNKISIITRPGPHCPYNGMRINCEGKPVTEHVDGCSFCGPLARIFFNPNKRIDIYLYDIQIYENQLKILDEGIYEYMPKPRYFPLNWYFPLRNCSFMGLIVQCPGNSEIILKDYYGNISMRNKCMKGKWI